MKKSSLFLLHLFIGIICFGQALVKFEPIKKVEPVIVAKQQAMQYRVTEFLIEYYDLGLWMPEDSVYYVYDPSLPLGHGSFDFIELSNFDTEPLHYLSEWLEMDKDDTWVGNYKYYNQFNAEDQRTSMNVEYWNGASYEGDARAEYIYTPEGLLETTTVLNYDGGGGYDPYYRYTYTYTDNVLTNILNEFYSGGWVNDMLTVYAYTGSGLIDNVTYNFWDGVNWDPGYRYLYSYDGEGNLIERLAQTYSAGWLSQGRYVYAYDAEGFNNEVKLQSYDGVDFIDYSKYELEEFEDGLPESNVSSYWDGFIWQPSYQTHFKYESYDDGVVSIDVVAHNNLLNIYPNPATDNLQIAFESPSNQMAVITIFNASGQMVNRQNFEAVTGNNIITKRIDNIPAGIYQLRLTIGGSVVMKSFIKE